MVYEMSYHQAEKVDVNIGAKISRKVILRFIQSLHFHFFSDPRRNVLINSVAENDYESPYNTVCKTPVLV